MTNTDILNYYSAPSSNPNHASKPTQDLGSAHDILDYYFEPTPSELFNNFIKLLNNNDIKLSEHLFLITQLFFQSENDFFTLLNSFNITVDNSVQLLYKALIEYKQNSLDTFTFLNLLKKEQDHIEKLHQKLKESCEKISKIKQKQELYKIQQAKLEINDQEKIKIMKKEQEQYNRQHELYIKRFELLKFEKMLDQPKYNYEMSLNTEHKTVVPCSTDPAQSKARFGLKSQLCNVHDNIGSLCITSFFIIIIVSFCGYCNIELM